MAKKEYTDEEIEELDSFLQNRFYYSIYNELTDKDNKYFELFEPLEFLTLVKDQIIFIEKYKNKPLFVARKLKSQSFTNDQFYYF